PACRDGGLSRRGASRGTTSPRPSAAGASRPGGRGGSPRAGGCLPARSPPVARPQRRRGRGSARPPPRTGACRRRAARSRVGGLFDGCRQPRLASIRLAAGSSPRLLLLGLALQLPDDLPLAIAVGLALELVVDERARDVSFEEVG